METQDTMTDLSLVNLFSDVANTHIDFGSLRYGFSIGDLNFIYDTGIACEVVKGAAIYSVPNTPTWMLGLINLRGSLVPVFSLEKYFDLKEHAADVNKSLLVLGKAEKAVAFQLKKYPELLHNLTKLEQIPKLTPRIDGYIVAAYQEEQGEKTWLELDKDKFFSTLGEKVCL
jgi:chemotaxis signal transduction protein